MAVCLFPLAALFSRAAWHLLLLSGAVTTFALAFPDVVVAAQLNAQQITDDAADIKSLDVYTDGTLIHILTGESRAGTDDVNLYYRRSADSGHTWSNPVRVDENANPPHRPHRGADAQIAAKGKHLVAAWTTKGSGFGDNGPLTTATSADGGLTWRPGPNPADDRTTTDHNYVDIAADRAGFHMVWLDGRGNGKPLQGLRYASSTDDGASWSANITLDAKTCECCWNTLLSAPDENLYTLYRGMKPLDMLLASRKAQTWSRLGPAGNFNWSVDVCPHTGGGLAMSVNQNAHTLHTAVWTGREGAAGVYYLSSTDGGKTWSVPRQFSDAWSKHPDIAASKDSGLALVWNGAAREDRKPVVFAALSADGGKNWTPTLRLSAPGVTALHPKIISVGAEFRVFWTETRGQHLLMMKNLVLQGTN